MECWPEGFPKMTSVLPDGVHRGELSIRHVTISEKDAQWSLLAQMRHGRGMLRAGDTHCQVWQRGRLWMSDTRDERRDHRMLLHRAQGEVLIGGLGLGMAALACALKPEVERVTVLEINQHMIDLVEVHLALALVSQRVDSRKLRVIRADVFEWKPDVSKFQTLWFDIWPTLCTDDLTEHTRLNRRYARWTAFGAYRSCWGHDLLRFQRGLR